MRDRNECLAHALSAARAKRWDEALARLLDLFRLTSNPRVASLVAQVSTLAEKGQPAVAGKNHDARVAAAEALIAEGNPRDLPRILRLFHDLRMAQADRLVEALGKVPRDPRFHDAALVLLRDPPFSSSTSMPFWRRYLELVDKQADPRTRPELQALDFSWLQEWSAEQFKTAIARLGVAKGAKRGNVAPVTFEELTDDERVACDAIETALGGSQVDGSALLAAIRARPDDDTARAVYADWLQEQGDPRGQFISLQLATHGRAPTEDERKAMKALLDEHGDVWLGELASILTPEQIRFSRGFVAAVGVLSSELPRLVKCEDAATIEELWVHFRESFDATLLRAKNLNGLRMVGGIEPEMLHAFVEAGPFSFTGVGIDLYDVIPSGVHTWTEERIAFRGQFARLRESFPSFTDLAIRAWYRDPAELAFVWASPLAVGLERLRISHGNAAYWIAYQDVLPKSVMLLECSFDFGFHGWAIELRRDDDGRFSRVVATLHPKARDFASVSLDDIARDLLDEVAVDALTELEVRAEGVRVVHSALDAIVAAAKRHSRLATLRLPGRAPIDLKSAEKPTTPVLTGKERARLAHEARSKEVAAALTAALESEQAPAVDLTTTAGLEALTAWLPTKKKLEARWADVALLVLSLPMPEAPPAGYSAAHRALGAEALRVFAATAPDKPFSRLRPLVDQFDCGTVMESINTHGTALLAPDELPSLLDWFESLQTMGANHTYYAVKDILAARGKVGRDEAKMRLETRKKLNRFHRWAYESVLE